ncbi:hypothetical protein K2173_026024 [Erythroxylum novogranatense]|uniref:C2HC zinc finger plants domain-containing protein n=1 Tax=Erythroxylum novogranatense TaxID=1862640 RepID=A0AAV8SIU0_9ROSI|nr:hypothetical protein K2173_026024 [Erythroxylum novogranatense]
MMDKAKDMAHSAMESTQQVHEVLYSYSGKHQSILTVVFVEILQAGQQLQEKAQGAADATHMMQIALDAVRAGSSIICLQCGGLVSNLRKDEHYAYWSRKIRSPAMYPLAFSEVSHSFSMILIMW